MMKLSRHVYGWTADPRVMDYYERLLFNVRLGTQDANGMLMYYVPLKPGMWKTFGTPFGAFWCCTGTGVEEYAKANDSIYFHDADSLYVNLFVGSELAWPQKGLVLTQDTNFPLEEGTTLTVRARKPTQLAIKIRIPYWATNGVTLKINGKAQPVQTSAGSYAILHRKWQEGDKVGVVAHESACAPLPDDRRSRPHTGLCPGRANGRRGPTKAMIYGDSGPMTSTRRRFRCRSSRRRMLAVRCNG
jgi:DUF1680 family protein